MSIIILVFLIIFMSTLLWSAIIVEEPGGLLFCLTILIPLFVWWVSYCNASWEYTSSRHKVHTVENIDIVVIDDKIFNLNRIMNKDLEEGEIINVQTPIIKKYVGIKPLESEEYELKFSNED